MAQRLTPSQSLRHTSPLFLLYLAWFRFPSMVTIYVITAIIGGFRLLSFFGWTFKVLVMRLAYLMRGKRLSGGPGGIGVLLRGISNGFVL